MGSRSLVNVAELRGGLKGVAVVLFDTNTSHLGAFRRTEMTRYP